MQNVCALRPYGRKGGEAAGLQLKLRIMDRSIEMSVDRAVFLAIMAPVRSMDRGEEHDLVESAGPHSACTTSEKSSTFPFGL